MIASDPPSPGLLATTTHARLRAAQGDHAAARRLLEELLSAAPEDLEARALLESLPEAGTAAPPDEPEAPLAPPETVAASELRERFRVALGPGSSGERVRRRLETVLRTIQLRRGTRDAR